jgi:AhpC/TSA antioxidant enzyme
VSCLSKSIDPAELSARNIELAIIGCGDSLLIKEYVRNTRSKYPIYADPTQSLHKEFRLFRTLGWGGKPDYMTVGRIGGAARGIWQGLKMGLKATKAGDIKQVGGEYGPSQCH